MSALLVEISATGDRAINEFHVSLKMENAKKLNTYQLNDITIGKNPILTQDDHKGSCNSALIYNIIEKVILPEFRGITVDKGLIGQSERRIVEMEEWW